VGLYLLGILGFYGLAQVQLLLNVGGGAWPGPSAVLRRYHGDPTRSTLHHVLDPTLATEDPKRMYGFLADTDEERESRRTAILAWVEAGTKRDGYEAVRPVFEGEATCGLCHSAKPDPSGARRARADLPFDTYEGVLAAARPDSGMSWAELGTTSHNHLFGFMVGALLVGWAFTGTRWRGPLVPGLVALTFVGAFVDVASWWLTKRHGAPWHLFVMGGGASFGIGLGSMAVLALDEVWLASALARLVEPILRALRLGRREARGIAAP
jgi:hypothetical protein